MHILKRETYDAIVVGSGISGGMAAKELCEKGLKTLVLERGRPLTHGVDYVTEHKNSWEFDYRNGGPTPRMQEEYPYIARTGYAIREATEHLLLKDADNPYIEEKPFTWVRGGRVGGRSLLWGRQCYRFSDMDLRANEVEGNGIAWPITYDELAPWYSYAERFVGITGEKLGLHQVPDGEFLPPMEMNAAEKGLRKAVEQTFPERNVTIGRAAILTENHNGRAKCHYCGPCIRGCSTASYYSSPGVALPAAERTGNLTVRPNSLVRQVFYDAETNKATGVELIDTETMEVFELRANLVFLCASTLASTQIMLNSTSSRFPNGLANDSGTLGHYLMDHHFQVGASAEFPGKWTDRYYQGNRPNGLYIPRFRNISPETKMRDFVRGYGFQGGGSRPSWGRGSRDVGFGAEFKRNLRNDPGPWAINLLAFGETLPRFENKVTLDENETDIYGLPLLRISADWGPNEFAMREDMKNTAAEMLEAAGGVNIQQYDNYTPGGYGAEVGLGIHEMGTARMGKDPRTSVLNGYCQAHAVDNLYVTDGSFMTSAGCQNPSITYLAMTARAVDHAVQQMA